MASRLLLEDLLRSYQHETGNSPDLESMGGVTAVQRIQQGEAADIAILSAGAIDQLMDEGKLLRGSKTDLFRSKTVMAVQAGQPQPSITTVEELSAAVLAATSIGVSSGPSGKAITALFEQWGITRAIADRLVVPPPGTPVGLLLAQGKIELGFQQLPELQHLDGVDIVGPLPDPIAITSTFAAAISPHCADQDQATDLLAFLGSQQHSEVIHHHGMEPAAASDL